MQECSTHLSKKYGKTLRVATSGEKSFDNPSAECGAVLISVFRFMFVFGFQRFDSYHANNQFGISHGSVGLKRKTKTTAFRT